MTTALQKLEASIEAQQKKLGQLKAKRQAIEAREKAAEQKEKRAIDTRRKILLGSFVLSRSSTVNISTLDIGGAMLADYLTRDDDRALFGFSPLPKSASSSINETSTEPPKQ